MTRQRPGPLATLAVAGGAALAALVACAAPVELPRFEPDDTVPIIWVAPTRPATVARVVDGDTVDVLLEPHGVAERVRLLGVDTPERGDCGFAEATAATAALLPEGAQIELSDDPTQDDRDRYQRLLRYIATADGTDVSTALVTTGWARVYDRYPVTRTPQLQAAETAARAEHAGAWGACHA